ncbi:MAG: NosD domain-containing protein [Elusimicrobiota bacterium]
MKVKTSIVNLILAAICLVGGKVFAADIDFNVSRIGVDGQIGKVSIHREMPAPPAMVENEIGQSFSLPVDGGYLTLESDVFIKVVAFSAQDEMLYLTAEKQSVGRVNLTITGLLPSTTYYSHAMGIESFMTDATGGAAFTLNLESLARAVWSSHPHGTITINSDGSLTPPAATNQVRIEGNVYTLLTSVAEPIEIKKSGIIFDGDSKSVSAPVAGSGTGILVYSGISNVTVKKVRVYGWDIGILAAFGVGFNLIGNTIENCKMGFSTGFTQLQLGSVISGNTIRGSTKYEMFIRETSGGVIIANNTIGPPRSFTASGIYVEWKPFYLTIENNQLNGPGAGQAQNEFNRGILLLNYDNVRNTVVRNNSITSWLDGIFIGNPQTVLSGVPLVSVEGNSIEQSVGGIGISNTATRGVVVASNTIGHGVGIGIAEIPGAVTDNVIEANVIIASTSNNGMYIAASQDKIRNNLIQGGTFGIEQIGSDGEFSGNQVEGVHVALLLNTVSNNNQISANNFYYSQTGILLNAELTGNGPDSNLIFNNNVIGTGPGIDIDQNFLNIEDFLGANALSSATAGGNYWSDLSSANFSDIDGDGIWDQPKVFNSRNKDLAAYVAPDGWGDRIKPGIIDDLKISSFTFDQSLQLTWTATGDDGDSGKAAAYEIAVATFLINMQNFYEALIQPGQIAIANSGRPQNFTAMLLPAGTTIFVVVKVLDKAKNFTLSNVASTVDLQR